MAKTYLKVWHALFIEFLSKIIPINYERNLHSDLEQEALQVEPPSPNEKGASDSVSGEDQIPSSSPGRNSLRDLVGRGKTTFRTFQGSRRGGYTINGPKLEQDYPHESIPLKVPVTNVEVQPSVPRSPLPKTTDEEYEYEFHPQPPSIPDEFLSAQSSPVQVLAIRLFEDEEHEVAPPPFEIDVEQRSPFSRSVQIIDIGAKMRTPSSYQLPLFS